MAEHSGAVVVGYDDSVESHAAIEWAAVEAARRGVDLVLLFATDQARLARLGVAVTWDDDEHQKVLAAVVSAGEERAAAAAPGTVVHARTSLLSAAVALTEASTDAALVVVGSRRHRRVSGVLLGSVAFSVASHAVCPVAVVPAEGGAPPDADHPVVVGVDGSHGSDLAVRAAVALAADTGAELVVVGVWETPAMDHWSRLYLADDEWRHSTIQSSRDWAQDNVVAAESVAVAAGPGVRVRTVVREGRADTVLAELAHGGALVVVGARGRGDLASLLLGSVSRGVMHRAECPVLVVR